MQEIPVASTKTPEQTALLQSPTWDTNAVSNLDFSNLLANESTVAQNDSTLLLQRQAELDRQSRDKQEAQQVALKAQTRDDNRETITNAGTDANEQLHSETPEKIQGVVDDQNNLQDMKDVPVDMESFQAMRPQLQKYGISDEDIATLERKVASEKGCTWGELVTFISQNMRDGLKTVDMTANQQQKLMTFFQKLGFSAPESKRMVADLANGNAEQINSAVQERLTTLPQDKLAGLNKEELDAFNEIVKKIQSQAKVEDRALIRVVGKAMESAMDKARSMAQEQIFGKQVDAGMGSDVKTLGQTASTKVDTDISKAAVFTNDTTEAEQALNKANDTEKLVKSLSTEDQLKARIGQTEKSVSEGAELSQNKDTDAFLKQDSGSNDKAWNAFFEKLQLDEAGTASTLKTDTTKAFSQVVDQARTTATNAAKPLTNAEAPRVLKQVENALLKNLSGGGKRLTLQLTPEHLGSISVALTVKKSEVSATIRADSPEAGKIIADQLESLRQSLEEQGLKVSKLEVQTQLPGGDQGTWQGMAGQEKGFQQGLWSRMRSSLPGNVANALTAEQLSEMAREAILSDNGNGLHVVA